MFQCYHKTQQYCSRRCATLARPIHSSEAGRKGGRKAAQVNRAKSLQAAMAKLGGGTEREARAYRMGERAGYSAGHKAGRRCGYREGWREALREEVA